MTIWALGVVAGIVCLIASIMLRRSGETRGAKYVRAFGVGVLVVFIPIAGFAEVRYRRCLAGNGTYSHCNWLHSNPLGGGSPDGGDTGSYSNDTWVSPSYPPTSTRVPVPRGGHNAGDNS